MTQQGPRARAIATGALLGHPPLAPGALWGSCRRCGQFHNTRQGWKP